MLLSVQLFMRSSVQLVVGLDENPNLMAVQLLGCMRVCDSRDLPKLIDLGVVQEPADHRMLSVGSTS
jgi:hypothetical protein